MRGTSRFLSLAAGSLLLLGLPVAVGVAAGAPEPGNDAFANAVSLGNAASGSAQGSNVDATAEVGEPSYLSGVSVWWSWTAPSSGSYLFDTCGSYLPSLLGVYTGASVSTLTQAAPTRDTCIYGGDYWAQDERVLDAVAGTTYYIGVGGSGGAMGSVSLHWRPASAPANDDFSQATLVAGSSGSASGTDRFATAQTGEPAILGGVSTWWRWTAPASGAYTFDTCGSDFDSTIGVYTGSSVKQLTPVTENNDGCSAQSQGDFTATARVTYYIGVGGFSSTDIGDIALHWQPATPPVNDTIDQASLISGDFGSATGDNRFATASSGDPAGFNTRTVWWHWTALSTGSVVFDTCGSSMYTVLGAVADTNRQLLLGDGAKDLGCLSRSMLMFTAESGVSYDIVVGGEGGDVALHWKMGSATDNDVIAAATSITGASGDASGTNMFATAAPDDPLILGLHTVWWRWHADTDGPVTMDTCGSQLGGSRVGVYTSAGGALTTVGESTGYSCGDDGSLTFTAVAGTDYYVGVGADNGAMGDILLRWRPFTLQVPVGVSSTAGSGKVLVTWSASSGVSGYLVRYRMVGAPGWSAAVAADGPDHYVVTGLTNGTTYEFEVAATSGTDTSDWSAAVTATPAALQLVIDSVTAAKNSITAYFTVSGGTWFTMAGEGYLSQPTCFLDGSTSGFSCASGVPITGVSFGRHTLTVQVTDADGATASATATVHVEGSKG